MTFDPQTVNGQKLMRKCKELRDENVKVHTKYQLHRDELAELLNKEKYTRGVLENGVIEACTAASQAHSERERLQSQLLKKQEEIHRLLAEKKEGWKLEKEARKKRRVERDEKRQAEVEALKAAHREEMEVLKLKLAEKEATVSAQSELIRALKQEAEQGKTNQQRGTSNTAMHDDTRDEDGKGVSKEMMEMVAAAVGETKDKEKE